MQKSIIRKGLVIGIIILFISVVTSPKIFGNSKTIITKLNNNLNNVGGNQFLDLAMVNYDNQIVVYQDNGDGRYGNRRNYHITGEPGSPHAGDFNNDKNLDILVLNYEKKALNFLYGYGNGTFKPAQEYPIGLIPAQDCGIYDYNIDGNLDIALFNYHYRNVSILLGNGDGTFRFHREYRVGKTTTSGVIEDFNKDHNIDIAVVNFMNDNVSILFGNGDGTFSNCKDYDVGKQPFQIVSGDFNNDDCIDLAITNQGEETISFLLNDGTGIFNRLDRSAGGARYLTTEDFNLDGNLDIAFTQSWAGKVGILLGFGNCTFSLYKFLIGNQFGLTTIISKDFNKDQYPDLAIMLTARDDFRIYLGEGNGEFGNHSQYPAGDSPGGIIAEYFRNQAPNKPTITGPTKIRIKTDEKFKFTSDDINQDNIFYFINWGDGTFDDWFGPYESGQIVTIEHKWNIQGNYTIRAKVRDICDAESQWETLEVTVPRTKEKSYTLLLRFLERFPLLKLLSYLEQSSDI